ncbi:MULTISPECIES: glycerate kinase type-2 family protein [unclassified Ensifer]|uniref:glycerate kinase type-2 family protein n=1 Tax=unclassified Ensifer TaxID=2633371 RepID=UPI00300F9F90
MNEGAIDPKSFLASLFDAAVAAADPSRVIERYLPPVPKGRTIVVGAGKGVAQLARALEAVWPGPLEGTVVTRYGYGTPCSHIEVLEASHPVPDLNGLAASARLFKRVRDLTPDDLVVALVCGGGSALLPAPPQGFDLSDEIALNEQLLKSGAPISVMNPIRRRFSIIKGGRLAAAAYPAKVVSLVVSDIPGDMLWDVASGPTIPAGEGDINLATTLEAYRIVLPERTRDHIINCAHTPSPDDARFRENETHLVASARLSLEAAAETAREHGVDAVILSDEVEGEARDAGLFHAALALEASRRDRPFRKPVVLLSGGETTVTVRSPGKGGRNTEFLLSLAIKIAGFDNIHAIAADTDGIDGTEDNAGAFADSTTVSRLRQAGIDPRDALTRNDTWTAFNALGDLFVPGPTGTNVNDFRAIVIL